MSLALWEMIVHINTFLKPLREANSQAAIAGIDLVELRSQLRTELEQLRAAITEQYSEREAYFVLFPLIAHCDELVKKLILDINQLQWPPLQQELYQVVDAGDLFYESLDNALAKPDTLPLVYQLYYFCLQDGFCGRHGINPERHTDYLNKLRQHIALQPIEIPPPASSSVAKKWANFRLSKRFYYGGAFSLLILLYFFLITLASTWQPAIGNL